MKAGVLVVMLDGGAMQAIASPTMDVIEAAAAKVRKDRTFKIGKSENAVIEAVVVRYNGGDATVAKRFSCRAEANRERIIAEQAKARKG
jgi:hypothetical protein